MRYQIYMLVFKLEASDGFRHSSSSHTRVSGGGWWVQARRALMARQGPRETRVTRVTRVTPVPQEQQAPQVRLAVWMSDCRFDDNGPKQLPIHACLYPVCAAKHHIVLGHGPGACAASSGMFGLVRRRDKPL